MGLIQKILDRHRQKVETRNKACDALIENIEAALQDAESVFKTTTAFISPEANTIWESKNAMLFSSIQTEKILEFKKAKNYETLLSKQRAVFSVRQQFAPRIAAHNDRVAKQKAEAVYAVIQKVEGKKLDIQQLSCISKQAHNHLIIAGAGTGKTTTVVGKIKYLLRTNQYRPEDILVLSFTHASASEMCERIQKETGEKIAASTFHKLGMDIINSVEGQKPKITALPLKAFNQEQQLYF